MSIFNRLRLRAVWFMGFLAAISLLTLVRREIPEPTLERVSVGALRFTSSGPLFLAIDRGYFQAENLDVDVRFFEAAPTIAVAVASGDLTFGSTALTAAFYNLAGEGHLKIIAGQAQEQRGHPGNAILVTRSSFDAGFTRVVDLLNQPFGMTQVGSPSHYQLGQIAMEHNVVPASIPLRTFQTLPNLLAALNSDQVRWAIIAPPAADNLIASRSVVSLGHYSDFASYQFGAVFTQTETVSRRADLVRAFLRAYGKGVADYSAMLKSHFAGDPRNASQVQDTAVVVARYVYPQDGPENGARMVLRSAFYVDPTGQVDVEDIRRQIKWYFEQGLVKRQFDAVEVMRLDLLH